MNILSKNLDSTFTDGSAVHTRSKWKQKRSTGIFFTHNNTMFQLAQYDSVDVMTFTYNHPFIDSVGRILVGKKEDVPPNGYYLPFCHCKMYVGWMFKDYDIYIGSMNATVTSPLLNIMVRIDEPKKAAELLRYFDHMYDFAVQLKSGLTAASATLSPVENNNIKHTT